MSEVQSVKQSLCVRTVLSISMYTIVVRMLQDMSSSLTTDGCARIQSLTRALPSWCSQR